MNGRSKETGDPAPAGMYGTSGVTGMGLYLMVTFTGEHSQEDLALLIEAIAGDLRKGSTSVTTEEYSWKLV